MIQAECARCSLDLDRPGGLLFSPPIVTGGPNATVNKVHLCEPCFFTVLVFIREGLANGN